MRWELALAFGAWWTLLACVAFDGLFVYDGNEQMCDETKTTEKQYLAPEVEMSFWGSIARGAIDWLLEGW